MAETSSQTVCVNFITDFPFSSLACLASLGMQNRRITAAQLSASSQWDGYHSPDRARLHNQRSGSYRESWSVGDGQNNIYQWIQIDLRIKTRVTYVATQGRVEFSQWITSYKLYFSDDGSSFQGFVQQGKNAVKVGYVSYVWVLRALFNFEKSSRVYSLLMYPFSGSFPDFHDVKLNEGIIHWYLLI